MLKFSSIAALGLVLFGALITFGIIQPFPSSNTCIGFFILGQCFGYYTGMSNGNNFILGIVLIAAGAMVYLLKRGRR